MGLSNTILQAANKGSIVYTAAMGGYNAFKMFNVSSPLAETKKRASESSGRYRPVSWADQPKNMSQLILVRPNIAYEKKIPTSNSTMMYGYFFDAFITEEHTSELVMTKHPVQNGAPISDHAYMLPVRLILEVVVSDAVDNFYRYQFLSGDSKSTSAFQILKALQSSLRPLQVCTKFGIYKNMLITREVTQADNKSINSLTCIVYLEQIISADVTPIKISVRPQVTDLKNKGPVSAAALDNSKASFLEQIRSKANIDVTGLTKYYKYIPFGFGSNLP
jgi:hypothetical protein